MSSALQWAATREFECFVNCEGQSHKTVSTNQTYEKARELKRGIELTSSAHQPNANADTRSGSTLFYVHRDHIDYCGRGAQGGHLDFHTVPELCSSALLYVHRGHIDY